jgi:hypothetical protein
MEVRRCWRSRLKVIGAGRFTPAPQAPKRPCLLRVRSRLRNPSLQPRFGGIFMLRAEQQQIRTRCALILSGRAWCSGTAARPNLRLVVRVGHPLGRFDTSSRQLKNCRLLIFF